MVQNLMKSFNEDVIKVTIKDKPGLEKQVVSERSLKKAFETLRQYAQEERRIRELITVFAEKNSKRKIRRYFEIWHDHTATMRKISEQTVLESKVSNDKKIELFVNAIAEKQKKLVTSREISECQKRTGETKSAPVKSNKSQINKQKRTFSGSNSAKCVAEAPTKNRLEAQKFIIEKQKVKLAEQNKFIQDMKLKEIDKEAKQTSKQTINIAKQALNQCDQRTRRSLIHLLREEGCRDKSVIEIPRIPSPPRFLIRMEARAEARKQRMKQADEIRQRKREEQKKLEEISQREAEVEERCKQIRALKEARRLRKEQENRRIKEIERCKRMEYQADQCYNKYLFRRYALEPLSSLVEEKHKRLRKADQHYGETLLLKIFSAWKNEWIDQQQTKLLLANKLYRHNLLWYAFDDWKIFALDMKEKYQVAISFYEMKLQGKYLKAWHTLSIEMKALMHEKEIIAINHYEKYLKIKFLDIWKQYMLISGSINEREQRRDEWRDLIKKFIPDTLKVKNSSLDS